MPVAVEKVFPCSSRRDIRKYVHSDLAGSLVLEDHSITFYHIFLSFSRRIPAGGGAVWLEKQ